MNLPPVVCRFARNLWSEWIRPMAAAAAIILPFKSAVADYNWVPTGSMKPTILEGDLVLVDKLAYDLRIPFTLTRLASWADPKPGDIVTFFSPKDGVRLVKRVIAGPGDTVEMRDEVLFLNGRRMDYSVPSDHPFRPEIYEDPHPVLAKEANAAGRAHWVMALPSRSALRTFSPVTVPANRYFMMGDSRDNSFDSRYFGTIERKQIVGRTGRVLLSLDKNHRYVPRLERSLSRLE
jgi:signal peptidase I